MLMVAIRVLDLLWQELHLGFPHVDFVIVCIHVGKGKSWISWECFRSIPRVSQLDMIL